MKICWKVLLVSITLWLLEEISLNLVGLDEYADYSEFLQDKTHLSTKPKLTCFYNKLCGLKAITAVV